MRKVRAIALALILGALLLVLSSGQIVEAQDEYAEVDLYMHAYPSGDLDTDVPEGGTALEKKFEGNITETRSISLGEWSTINLKKDLSIDGTVAFSLWANGTGVANFSVALCVNNEKTEYNISSLPSTLTSTPLEFTGSLDVSIELESGDSLGIEVIVNFRGTEGSLFWGSADYDSHITVPCNPITIEIQNVDVDREKERAEITALVTDAFGVDDIADYDILISGDDFTAESITGPEVDQVGNALQLIWKWNYGYDGVEEGDFTARVNITDNSNNEWTKEKEFLIEGNRPPTAVLKADKTEVEIGEKVTFNAEESYDEDGDVAEYFFDFGDGNNTGWTTSYKAMHSYSREGEYTASLKVRDNEGDESTNVDKLKITVSYEDDEPPIFNGIAKAENTKNGGELRLEWDKAEDESTPITYNIYISTQSKGQDLNNPSYTTQKLEYTVKNLDNGKEYYFIVRAEDAEGNEDDNTKELSAMPTDEIAPVFDGIESVEDAEIGGTLELSWNKASDNSLPILYNIYQATSKGDEDFGSPTYTTKNTTFTVTGLENGEKYYFVVRAEDAEGNEDDNTKELSATPTDSTPPSFMGVQSVREGRDEGSVILEWNEASDDSTPITYNIYISTLSGMQDFDNANFTTDKLSIEITLRGGHTYYFIVRAEDAEGNEDSNVVEKSIYIKSPDPTPVELYEPENPTKNSLELSWSKNQDSDFDRYEIHKSALEEFKPKKDTRVAVIDDRDITTYTVTKLEEERTYYFIVRVYDYDGYYSDSNKVSGTTTANALPELLNAIVEPDSGDTETTFKFTVVYSDKDNDVPEYVYVFIDDDSKVMRAQSENDYTEGVKFHFETKLSKGSHTIYFECSDGDEIVKTDKFTVNVKEKEEKTPAFELIVLLGVIGVLCLLRKRLYKLKISRQQYCRMSSSNHLKTFNLRSKR